MVWSIHTSNGFESDKVAAISARYLQGERVLDIGCGMRKVWPSVIGVDNQHHFGSKTAADIKAPAHDLSLFADDSVDAIFSSHLLEHYIRKDVVTVLEEWSRVLKEDGYIVLYLPSANHYPLCGENGANPDHKWDIYPGDIESMFKAHAFGNHNWRLIESEERSDNNEYSLFIVLQKGSEVDPNYADHDVLDDCTKRSHDRKQLLVIRYGAIGDMIQTATLFPDLVAQGYDITVNCSFVGAQVLKNNPYVEDIMPQRDGFVPNNQLLPYWLSLGERFDKVINLSESVEGSLLALPGRMLWNYSDVVRHKLVGHVNYLDHMATIAEARTSKQPSFYATREEHEVIGNVVKQVTSYDGSNSLPLIVWCVNGSGPDKIYPYIAEVIRRIVDTTNAQVILTGDAGTSAQIAGAVMHVLGDVSDRVFNKCGCYNIRQALTLVSYADVIVGPETGAMNCAAFQMSSKVLLLSHSSRENLSRDWVRTKSLSAPNHIPSHKLHKDFNDCEQDPKTKAAVCMAGISPDEVYANVRRSLLTQCKKRLITKG